MTQPVTTAEPTPLTPGPNGAPNAGPPAPLGAALAWLADRAALDEEARAAVTFALPGALAPGAADPGPLVQGLLDAERPADALRVVACALPPREGVWWAWVSARHAMQAMQARADAARANPPTDGPPPLPPTPAQIT